MKKEIIVLSLGGSLIVPDNVDYKYLHYFEQFIKKLKKDYKIVIVTGGGKTARNYISSLKKEKANEYFYSMVGIMSTKLNARLVSGFFNLKDSIPDDLNEVKKQINRRGLAVCGALGFQANMTSDGDAAEIAEYLGAGLFVNLTNVDGLYSKNPAKYKNAELISKIDYSDFLKIVNKMKYEAGQHFVLDQAAARIITRAKIKTLIINGKKLDNLTKYLNRKKFLGTLIS